jgi:hypothetical protein
MRDTQVIREDKYMKYFESYKGLLQDYTRTLRALPELEHLS